jgi:hypothetical protein
MTLIAVRPRAVEDGSLVQGSARHGASRHAVLTIPTRLPTRSSDTLLCPLGSGIVGAPESLSFRRHDGSLTPGNTAELWKTENRQNLWNSRLEENPD